MAIRLARNYDNTAFNLDDRIGVALLTLTNCARRYDPTMINPDTGTSYAFSTFAWVSITRALRTAGRIETTGSRQARTKSNGSPIIQRTGADAWIDAFSGSCSGEFEDIDNRMECEAVLELVDERSRYVLWEYANGKKGSEIGKDLGISKARVHQIRNAAIETIQLRMRWRRPRDNHAY